MNNDLKLIKKYYGEEMMHLCRDLFPSLLEKEGLLFSIIDKHFGHNHSLGSDIKKQHKENEFKNYIYNFTTIRKKINTIGNNIKTPSELLDEAGYKLYECKVEKDIQIFKKYYVKNEELCTFRGGRLNSCYVFFAVKKNVDEIKREDFQEPHRQDLYGTSVISIQFTRGNRNFVSIKNRYNHTVNNPDATFGNNLENIIPGLTESFNYHYHFNVNSNSFERFELDNYLFLQLDQKYYKYNYEINDVYYCPNNMIIYHGHFDFKYQDKSRYLLMDYVVFDMVSKTFDLYDYDIDSFKNPHSDSILNLYDKFTSFTIEKKNHEKTLSLYYEDGSEVKITIDKDNKIISLWDNRTKEIENNFLFQNKFIQNIYMEKVTKIGDSFLFYNRMLKKITIPKLKEVGDAFLAVNESLKKISFPNLVTIGNHFLESDILLASVSLPKVISIGEECFRKNEKLKKISLPSVIKIGCEFLRESNIKQISMPNLRELSSYSFQVCPELEELNLESVQVIGTHCFQEAENLVTCNLPNVIQIGSCFGQKSEKLETLVAPNLIEVGGYFLENNMAMKSLTLESLKKTSCMFLPRNQILEEINLPSLEYLESDAFVDNLNVKRLYLPMVKDIGHNCFYNNVIMEELIIPNAEVIRSYSFVENQNLINIYAPNLHQVQAGFLSNNDSLKRVDMPSLKMAEYGFLFKNTCLEYIKVSLAFYPSGVILASHPNQEIELQLRLNGEWEKAKTLIK